MPREMVDRRVLGAVELVDATTTRRILRPLELRSDTASFRRTRLGLYAIVSAQGLEAHTDAFDAPPTEPAQASINIEMRIRDPQGGYLERRARMALPRDPSSADPLPESSVFRSAPVTMFAAPAGLIAVNWGIVRASVLRQSDGAPLSGALVLVRESGGGPVRGRGLTDRRGEAMAAVEGIPVVMFNQEDDGPVTTTQVAFDVVAVFDPDMAAPPDPDELENRIAELPLASSTVQLAPGREAGVTLPVAVPDA